MTTEIRLRVDDNADLTAAREAADGQGVALREIIAEPTGELDEQVEPVTAVLIAAGVVAGARMILDWWGRRKGGLVIDLRPSASDMLYRDHDLAFGYVVTVPAEGGKVTLDVKDLPDAAEKWVSEVISGSYKTLSDLAKAAKAAVGADRVQTASAA